MLYNHRNVESQDTELCTAQQQHCPYYFPILSNHSQDLMMINQRDDWLVIEYNSLKHNQYYCNVIQRDAMRIYRYEILMQLECWLLVYMCYKNMKFPACPQKKRFSLLNSEQWQTSQSAVQTHGPTLKQLFPNWIKILPLSTDVQSGAQIALKTMTKLCRLF